MIVDRICAGYKVRFTDKTGDGTLVKLMTDGILLNETASDRDLLRLRPYFATCRQQTVFNPPDQVRSDWNNTPIGVCTTPAASWQALWPHLKHYN